MCLKKPRGKFSSRNVWICREKRGFWGEKFREVPARLLNRRAGEGRAGFGVRSPESNTAGGQAADAREWTLIGGQVHHDGTTSTTADS
jgi:hypothetical protein